jgi:Fur family ferric uptake transcriptional regulator
VSDVDLPVRLRERGYRQTAQRQAVFDAVVALTHATPDEILRHVQAADASLNLSTVYRALDVLEDIGVVRHTHLTHGSPTYHVADSHRHLHLVCSRCGDVLEVPLHVADPLVATLREEHGFLTDVDHFGVQGLCRACSDAGETE